MEESLREEWNRAAMSDFDARNAKQGNAGFRYGLAGAAISIAVNLVLLLLNEGQFRGDFLSWLAQLGVYFFISRSAAEAQYQANQRSGDFEYLRGVQGAGLGAALITSILTWVYIFIRNIILDSFGAFIFVEPFSLFCVVSFDVALAMAIGSAGGRAASKRHSPDDPYT